MTDQAVPPIADRAQFDEKLSAIRRREKAHTVEADAIAAARRRLPMVELGPGITVTSGRGTVPISFRRFGPSTES